MNEANKVGAGSDLVNRHRKIIVIGGRGGRGGVMDVPVAKTP